METVELAALSQKITAELLRRKEHVLRFGVHAPAVDALRAVMCTCDICSRKCDGQPAQWFVISEAEAERIVAAVEDGHAHELLCILKRQAWWASMVAGVRARRHLKPESYIGGPFV